MASNILFLLFSNTVQHCAPLNCRLPKGMTGTEQHRTEQQAKATGQDNSRLFSRRTPLRQTEEQKNSADTTMRGGDGMGWDERSIQDRII
jgi:hypothetical protein